MNAAPDNAEAKRNAEAERAVTVDLVILLPAAALTCLPMGVINPDFARNVLEWGELALVPVIATATFAAIGFATARLGGGYAAVGALRGAVIALLASLGLTAWAIAGPGLATAAVGGCAVLAATVRFGRARDRAGPAFSWAIGVLGAFVALLVAAWVGAEPHEPERQLLVIGLDGASWDLIDEVRGQGRAPTFDRLIAEGARGELDTLEPLVSPALWTSIASGQPPRVHGIHDFAVSAHDVEVKRIWDITTEQGIPTGVFGHLVTWPPDPSLRFMVPGFLAHDLETNPPSLGFIKEMEILEKERDSSGWGRRLRFGALAFRNGMTLSTLNAMIRRAWVRQSASEAAIAGRLAMLALRTDLFCHQLRRTGPELAIFYHHQIDAAGHLFYKYHRPEGFREVTPGDVDALGDVLPMMYEATDAALARIGRCARPDADWVIVSDHGQRAARGSGDDFIVIRTSKLLAALALEGDLRATNVGRYVYLRPARPDADWELALRKLASVRRSSDGEPVVKVALRREGAAEMIASPAALDAATIVVDDVEYPSDAIFATADRVSGEHTRDAILLVSGPRIADGVMLPRGSLLDVMPTLLWLLDLPVGRDLPGRVIEEVLRPDLLATHPVETIESYGARARSEEGATGDLPEHVRTRLRALGYIE